ncbi:Ca-activated chloride channel family protein [Shimia gijangensis]|uniref:Ca-activated chloride channel family protein n=1 Tax=Shimia gijangensis TaxID=1470563 RepID=A0A1M6BEF5_9RHOB|nr:VWA domain-containing protein [Shimia gijangensis]SHI47099.1 Ca-activated chloride channel family protein [Shimia gijangensis]
MSDDFDLDDLKAAMTAATPAPDGSRKAENLALAQKNFDQRQGSTDETRLTSDAPKRGLFRGVIEMLQTFPAKAALTATTAMVAVGMIVYLPSLNQAPGLDDLIRTERDVVVLEAEEVVAADLADMAVKEERLSKQRVQSADAPIARLAAPQAEVALGYAQPAPSPEPIMAPQEGNTEAFPEADSNPLKVTAEEPVSTFSIDVDTAAYGIVRNSIENGYLPNADAVRVEEMVNYFPYDYAAPAHGEAPFATHVTTFQTPWNAGTQLVHIGLQGQMPAVEDRPPLNLVFLIDTSGSMNNPDKLPLLKQSFALMLSELRAEDSVAIVTYAGSAGQVLAPTPASDRATILASLNQLDAGGSTAGQAGLQQAYATAEAMAEDGEVSRVILATDGDFNVGLSDPDALKDFIAGKRDSGTYLSVLGFGRGNLDDATMQALAQNGNGQAAYIDTLNEAQKVLVDQLTGALFPIANDVKIQVEFNPAQVAEYRLIGYETRMLNREDFNNDKVDAGEIGAGHSVTALYEITPVDSEARLTDPLRYGAQEDGDGSNELGFLKLRYKEPGADSSQLIETPIIASGEASAEMQFAAAIAGFGQLLKDDKYLGDWSWGDAIALANGARGTDAYGYRAEAVQLMRLAQSLSAQ